MAEKGFSPFRNLVQSLPKRETQKAEIDVSYLFPAQEEATIFVYADLETKRVFDIPPLVEMIKRQRPTWSDELSQQVAVLSACHIAPEAEPAEIFILYTELAERLSAQEFAGLLMQFYESFPHLKNFEAATNEAKKKSNGAGGESSRPLPKLPASVARRGSGRAGNFGKNSGIRQTSQGSE
jgi:hypothetical protein